LAAAVLKCLDGEIQTRFYIGTDEEKQKIINAGFDLDKTYFTDDLAKSDDIICAATGVTDGEFLNGVRFGSHKAKTYSVVMRARTRTVRYIEAIHNLDYKTVPSRELNQEQQI
jgi:fructose-1,6-bisphosphatase II